MIHPSDDELRTVRVLLASCSSQAALAALAPSFPLADALRRWGEGQPLPEPLADWCRRRDLRPVRGKAREAFAGYEQRLLKLRQAASAAQALRRLANALDAAALLPSSAAAHEAARAAEDRFGPLPDLQRQAEDALHAIGQAQRPAPPQPQNPPSAQPQSRQPAHAR